MYIDVSSGGRKMKAPAVVKLQLQYQEVKILTKKEILKLELEFSFIRSHGISQFNLLTLHVTLHRTDSFSNFISRGVKYALVRAGR